MRALAIVFLLAGVGPQAAASGDQGAGLPPPVVAQAEASIPSDEEQAPAEQKAAQEKAPAEQKAAQEKAPAQKPAQKPPQQKQVARAPAQPPPAQPSPPCPPPQPGAAQQAPPGSTISGSSICGATIVGGTISGATIIGGTISNGAIAGGNIAGSKISGTEISGSRAIPDGTLPGSAPAEAPPAAPSTGAAPGAPPATGQPAPPAHPAPVDRPADKPGRNAVRSGAARAGARREPSAQEGGGDSEDEDDEDLAARALERALVQRGALLLPVWGFEIVPGFNYGHTSQDTFTTVTLSDGAPPTTVGVRKRTHQLTGSLTARLGLPADLQLEASMPATFALSDVDVAGAARNDASGFGMGDPRLSLSWRVIRAGDIAPDVFIAGGWKPKTGSSPYDAKAGQVGLGTGYDAVGGTLTAVKAADPLVLLANAGYTANLPVTTSQGRRNPGDTFGLGGGAILAVSPDTSLSFLLDFHYKPEDTLAGKSVLGSDETVAVLQLGLGRVLSRTVLLNFTAALGLTADSPNFQLGVSMPVRF